MKTELKKPKAKLSGKGGNVFSLGAICSSALEKAGQPDQAKEMKSKIIRAKSYDEAIQIMMTYCDVS